MAQLDQTKTWKLVTLFFILVALSALTYYGWNVPQAVVESFAGSGKKINLESSRTPNPSPASKTQLNQFVDSKDWILGINVISVDFRQNTRSSTYRYFKEPAIEAEWVEFDASKKVILLFGEDEAANQRLVNLINGQFVCIRTLDVPAEQIIKSLSQHSLATCLAPIPPGYGDFIGFINVFLRRQPTGAEILLLENVTRQISLDIYQRDIVKSTRAFGELFKR